MAGIMRRLDLRDSALRRSHHEDTFDPQGFVLFVILNGGDYEKAGLKGFGTQNSVVLSIQVVLSIEVVLSMEVVLSRQVVDSRGSAPRTRWCCQCRW
jgi:hypothetical protein